MKKMFMALASAALFFVVSCNNEKKDDKAKQDEPVKTENTAKEAPAKAAAHVCTDQCKEGNHAYAHGEEGHTCTDACMKDHSCTDKCKEGNHAYAHGEKGHACTDECKNMPM